GWAASCLDAGLSVSLLVPDEAGQADLAARIAAIHDEAVVRQRMSPAQRDEKRARRDVSGGRAALNAVDLVISVGAEDLAPLEAATRPGAILASAVPPGHAVTPDGLSRPADLVGLQVTSPAHVARLVEVLSGPGTAPDVLLTLMRLFKKTGRVAVLSPAEEGGIGAAVWGACVWVAEALVSMGAAPEEVDDALRGYGFTRTPFQTRTPRTTRGTPRDFATDEIVQRCLVAMANTGALLVEAGAARRPSDVDMVMIHGYGFPRWHGGPMMAADLTGLLLVKETLKVLTGEDAGFWAPSDLFDELIKNGRHFADLND
ncbi:MAG: 3-hydroxyacyl-CoA dehydrogenase NAD-binding domain-containing protein, partial [Paracoccaceae bacterium]